MGHRKNLTLSKEPALWKYKYSIMNIICHHEHSVSVAKYIPKKVYTKMCLLFDDKYPNFYV